MRRGASHWPRSPCGDQSRPASSITSDSLDVYSDGGIRSYLPSPTGRSSRVAILYCHVTPPLSVGRMTLSTRCSSVSTRKIVSRVSSLRTNAAPACIALSARIELRGPTAIFPLYLPLLRATDWIERQRPV